MPINFSALPGTHFGTGRFSFAERLVAPQTVDRPVTESLNFVELSGDFHTMLIELHESTGLPAKDLRYLAVAFRHGITDISTVNVFCHPNPDYAGMPDSDYPGLQNKWSSLYRYAQYFGVQLAAAQSNMVWIMPMLANSRWTSAGPLRPDWREILNLVLVEVQKVVWPAALGARNTNALENIILSCFSAGRTPLNALRSATAMDTSLREVWDFDGYGGDPGRAPAGGQLLWYNQATGGAGFNLPASRWSQFGTPQQLGKLHGHFPQRLALHAATMSRYGH